MQGTTSSLVFGFGPKIVNHYEFVCLPLNIISKEVLLYIIYPLCKVYLFCGLVKCELRVANASYELRVTSCELLLFCELRVASSLKKLQISIFCSEKTAIFWTAFLKSGVYRRVS